MDPACSCRPSARSRASRSRCSTATRRSPAGRPSSARPPALAAQVVPPTTPSRGSAARRRPWRCRCRPRRARAPTSPGRKPDGGSRASAARHGGQVAVAAVAGDACTNAQYTFFQSASGGRWLRLLRQPQPLQLQRHVGRVDRRRPHATGTRRTTAAASTTSRTSRRSTSARRARRSTRTPTARRSPTAASLASICPGALACTWLFTNASGQTTRDRPALQRELHVLERRRGRRLRLRVGRRRTSRATASASTTRTRATR